MNAMSVTITEFDSVVYNHVDSNKYCSQCILKYFSFTFNRFLFKNTKQENEMCHCKKIIILCISSWLPIITFSLARVLINLHSTVIIQTENWLVTLFDCYNVDSEESQEKFSMLYDNQYDYSILDAL